MEKTAVWPLKSAAFLVPQLALTSLLDQSTPPRRLFEPYNLSFQLDFAHLDTRPSGLVARVAGIYYQTGC